MLVKSENSVSLKPNDAKHFIKVPLCHQETPYSCGVACVQSILAGYGIIYAQDVLAEWLKQKPIYGTDYKDILAFMKRLGFQASFQTDMDIHLLKSLINKNITPILLIQAWKDTEIDYTYDWKDPHYVIACGYEEDRLLFMDPWTLGYYTFIPYNRLMIRWHALDFLGNPSRYPGLIIQHEHLPFVYKPDSIKPME